MEAKFPTVGEGSSNMEREKIRMNVLAFHWKWKYQHKSMAFNTWVNR